ncbi:uncharacterized protein LOC134814900 [Bolinopsis microptera]|uniref:uncharacterized protein LOC134814900 n=1 Tax=Bolinopsis microptera TaxID=2820187 RepID=UPI00307A14BA
MSFSSLPPTPLPRSKDQQRRYQTPRLNSYRLTPPPTPTILPPTQQPDVFLARQIPKTPYNKLVYNITNPYHSNPFWGLAQKEMDQQCTASLSKVQRIRTSKDGSVIAISCDGSMAFSYLSRVSHKSYWMRELRLKSESQLRHCIQRIKQQIGAIICYLIFAGLLRLYTQTHLS